MCLALAMNVFCAGPKTNMFCAGPKMNTFGTGDKHIENTRSNFSHTQRDKLQATSEQKFCRDDRHAVTTTHLQTQEL